MKLKDIASILRAGRTINILEGKDCQWLSDGFAAYPIYGLPHMEEKNMTALLDIPENKRELYNVQPGKLPFDESDNCPDEFQLSDSGITIVYRGTAVIPLIGNHKLFYVRLRYLKPFFSDKESYTYYARKTDGGCSVAVKEGFILRAVIAPYDIVYEEFTDLLGTIYNRSLDILSEKKEEKLRRIELQRFMNEQFTEGEE